MDISSEQQRTSGENKSYRILSRSNRHVSTTSESLVDSEALQLGNILQNNTKIKPELIHSYVLRHQSTIKEDNSLPGGINDNQRGLVQDSSEDEQIKLVSI